MYLLQVIDCCYCINLERRTDRWEALRKQAVGQYRELATRLQRYPAVDGRTVDTVDPTEIAVQWDSTNNAKYSPKETAETRTMNAGEIGCALSHIGLWRKLVETERHRTMLILEDDASLRANFDHFFEVVHRYLTEQASGFDMLYLGFSSRGEREYLVQGTNEEYPCSIYRPEYGYHTHAYVITKTGAETLLRNLPVCGPIDVWLGDNQWFGLNVRCAVQTKGGWTLPGGGTEGKELIRQMRHRFQSDIKSNG